jgi:hypothetical protein
VKIRLLLALAGLAIGSAVPALAQASNAVDPQVRQEIEAALIKFEEAFNKQDATAIAALFTLDAAEVAGSEMADAGSLASGREAIEKKVCNPLCFESQQIVAQACSGLCNG